MCSPTPSLGCSKKLQAFLQTAFENLIRTHFRVWRYPVKSSRKNLCVIMLTSSASICKSNSIEATHTLLCYFSIWVAEGKHQAFLRMLTLCSKLKVERETFSSPFAQSGGGRIVLSQSPRDDHNNHFIFLREICFSPLIKKRILEWLRI